MPDIENTTNDEGNDGFKNAVDQHAQRRNIRNDGYCKYTTKKRGSRKQSNQHAQRRTAVETVMCDVTTYIHVCRPIALATTTCSTLESSQARSATFGEAAKHTREI